MKLFSIIALLVYEIWLIYDNETYFLGNDIDRFFIKLIPIIMCLILGLG